MRSGVLPFLYCIPILVPWTQHTVDGWGTGQRKGSDALFFVRGGDHELIVALAVTGYAGFLVLNVLVLCGRMRGWEGDEHECDLWDIEIELG